MFQDMTGTEHDWISQNRQDGKKGNKEDGGKEGGRQGGGGVTRGRGQGLEALGDRGHDVDVLAGSVAGVVELESLLHLIAQLLAVGTRGLLVGVRSGNRSEVRSSNRSEVRSS